MTVRHRQRKGAKSGFFLYAREKAFSKPQLFPPKPPEDSLKVPNNPTRPASFLRQFSPQHSPVAHLFRGKKGLFSPPAPAVPAFSPARTPRFAPAPPVFLPGARPDGDPACPRFCPGPRRPRTPLEPRKPRVCGFLPARTRFCPPCAARTPEDCPAHRRHHPAVRRQPARCRRPPPEGQPPPRRGTALGLATPTAEVGFPASP